MMIFELRLSDLNQMAKIEAENFTKPWSYKTLYYEVILNQKSYFYGAFIDDFLVGYLGFWQMDDNIDIINVAVCKKHQQEGIGSLLFEHLDEIINDLNVKTISLEVRVNNIAALKLYEKNDFIILRKIKNYYPDTGDDAYFMQKIISK